MAVLTGQAQTARLLVVCGAHPGIKDIEGNTPLHHACRRGDLDCVRALTEPIAVAETEQARTKYSTTFIHERRLSLEERNYDGTCLKRTWGTPRKANWTGISRDKIALPFCQLTH